MLSPVSLPSHTFLGQALSFMQLTSACASFLARNWQLSLLNQWKGEYKIFHDQSPRKNVAGSNLWPCYHQSQADPTEPPRPAFCLQRFASQIRAIKLGLTNTHNQWHCLDSCKISILSFFPASILRKSTSSRHRSVSYPDRPMTARYRFT